MRNWTRYVRGALGMGLAWAVAGGLVGAVISLGFVVGTGSIPDAPFPIMFGALGFISGLLFAGVLRLAEGRRQFEQMSIARFAGWGAAVGAGLSGAFFLAVSRGDPTFMKYFAVVGPLAAVTAAGCAAGSLALARRSQTQEVLRSAAPSVASRLRVGEHGGDPS